MTKEQFLAKNPYELERIGDYIFYEHPDYGDESPIYMLTPSGNLINTMFYDMGDFYEFGLELCQELERG